MANFLVGTKIVKIASKSSNVIIQSRSIKREKYQSRNYHVKANQD